MRSFSSSRRRATWCRYSGTWVQTDTRIHIHGQRVWMMSDSCDWRKSHSHLAPASAAVPRRRTDDWSRSKTSPQRNLCKPEKKGRRSGGTDTDIRSVYFTVCWESRRPWSTCRSDSMPSRLLRRLRSIVSPLRSSSICSKMPSTVRFCTALSLTMWVRNSSKPVSLQETDKISLLHKHKST